MSDALISVEQGVEYLNQDGVIGMPTETVYGLAARIDRPLAIQKIFTTKERPFFDPLIVHVSSKSQAQKLTTDWNSAAEVLANAFWPGPLTMVLSKASHVDPLITSGLQSVGIRMPRHPIALALMTAVNCPLAAPSANLFGRTSPTQAVHVLREFQNKVPVIDGGPSDVGIESTVLHVQESAQGIQLSLLRPGFISIDEIAQVLQENKIPFLISEVVQKSLAPGQMKHHYMPDIPLFWVENDQLSNEQILIIVQQQLKDLPSEVEGVKLRKPHQTFEKSAELILPNDPALAARRLYSLLRELSQTGADHIIYRHHSSQTGGLWDGILDRLKKASHLVLS